MDCSISNISRQIPHLPNFKRYTTGKKIAAVIITAVSYPVAQAINACIAPLLAIYGVASVVQQFLGNTRQWSEGHRFVMLSACPFIGALYMSCAFAGKILE